MRYVLLQFKLIIFQESTYVLFVISKLIEIIFLGILINGVCV